MSHKYQKSRLSNERVIVDRRYAEKVVGKYAYAISRSDEPEVASSLIANLFAADARFCSPARCVVGKENIKAEFLNYLNQKGEKDQFLQINDVIWDQEKLSGSVLATWGATVIIRDYIPGVAPGQSYTQDDVHVFRLNEEGKVTLWIESFNPSQTIAFICPSKKTPCCRA